MTCAPHKVGPGGPKLFDMDATVPPTVRCWNIAEKNCEPVPVQIKPTLYRKWDQLLTSLASKCGCGQGVRALYTPSGHQFKELVELTEGIDVVVVPMGYKFDKASLPSGLLSKM